MLERKARSFKSQFVATLDRLQMGQPFFVWPNFDKTKQNRSECEKNSEETRDESGKKWHLKNKYIAKQKKTAKVKKTK